MKISFFPPVKEDEKHLSIATLTIDEWLNGVRSGRWDGDLIQRIRSEPDKGKRDALKLGLSSVTPSGVFSHRKGDKIITHSGFICLDIDTKHNPQGFDRAEIVCDPYAYATMLSVSGLGLAVLVRINPEKHKESFAWLYDHFKKTYNVTLDTAPSNPASIRYNTFDPDIIINKDAKIAPYKEPPKQQTAPIYKNGTVSDEFQRVKTMSLECQQRNIDIAPNYDPDYIELAFILANTFNESGRELFHNFCTPHPTYEYVKADAKYTSCLRDTTKNAGPKKGLGTLIERLRAAGVTDPRTKQNSVSPKNKTIEQKTPNENYFFEFKTEIVRGKDVEKCVFYHGRLIELLNSLGFRNYKIDFNDYDFVRLTGNIISRTDITHIKKAVQKWCKSLGLEKSKLAFLDNAIVKNDEGLFSEKKLQRLDVIENHEFRDTKDRAFIVYQNGVAVVSKDGVKLEPHSFITEGYVWADHILDRKLNLTGSEVCEFGKFLLNVSGNKLEVYDQFQTYLGFLLHKYKNPAKQWGVLICEQNENPDDGGGTGKSVIVKALAKMVETAFEDGKKWKHLDQFAYQKVTRTTKLMAVEDLARNFNVENLNAAISDTLSVNKKNKAEFSLPFNRSPKFVFTTNYTLDLSRESSRRRVRVMALANYYNKDYNIESEFGHLFFDEWDQAEYNAFDNFMLGCLYKYLHSGLIEIEPGESYRIKSVISKYGAAFVEWAKFAFNGEVMTLFLDFYSDYVWLSDVKNHFLAASGESEKKFTNEYFANAVKAFLQAKKVVFDMKRGNKGVKLKVEKSVGV